MARESEFKRDDDNPCVSRCFTSGKRNDAISRVARASFGRNNNRSTKMSRSIVIAFPTAFSFVRIFRHART